jgi:putative two-component system response regulator
MINSLEITDRAYFDTLFRMAVLAEFHKPDIRQHLERIRRFCYIMGRGLGLSNSDADVLSHASILHDIGEIGIPEVVFTKAGSLTAHEWELVKRHPTIGSEMLHGSPSVILQAAEIIALTHHERWDGSGYPCALRGKEIPLSGRICGMADIFDALTTKRPYKQPISPAEANQIILKASGQMFDPELVKIFKNLFDEIVRSQQGLVN